MIVTLVGYRGCGKTSVAPLLAARLGWDRADADEEIERRAGCSIREIFAEQGEDGFRRMEREVVGELLAGGDLVLAAGGGAVLDAGTRAAMRAAGPVVWLRAGVDTILARLEGDAGTPARRPALTNDDPRAEVTSLLAAREPLYREVATIEVRTDGATPAEIVETILAQLPPGGREKPA